MNASAWNIMSERERESEGERKKEIQSVEERMRERKGDRNIEIARERQKERKTFINRGRTRASE